jgi:hypothetical protein
MVARATGSGGHTTLEAERRKIEFLDEEVDNSNKVILANPVLEAIREKRDLFPVNTIDETRDPSLPLPCGSLPRNSVFTQPRPNRSTWQRGPQERLAVPPHGRFEPIPTYAAPATKVSSCVKKGVTR